MSLQYIEHYLVQTDNLARSIAWYEEVLRLSAGPTPNFGFPVQWMYIGDRDVVHLTHGGSKTSQNRKAYLGQQSMSVQGSGVIDHVAFRGAGLAEMIRHFEAQNIEFTQRQVSAQGLYQLFLFDPNSVKIELNFDVEEAHAAGITPPIVASSFEYQDVKD